MRLLSLEVENFRKFRRPHRIESFGPRLNLLCGPNEFGKSTLLAALSAAFFQRHGSKSAAVRALQPHGSETAPRVSVAFETGGERWRLEKQFLARPFARLARADGRRFDDDAAETRLRELLGVEAGGKAESLGLWSALWVTQGGSFSQAPVETPSTRTAITRCLEAELGSVAGFGRADALLRKVESELGTLRDRNGKPIGARRVVAADIESLRARVSAFEERRERLAQDVADLGTMETEQAALQAQADPGGERLEILELREALAKAQMREAELSAARSALTTATLRRDQARAEIAARTTLRARVEALRSEAVDCDEKAREAAAADRAGAEALGRAREALSSAEAEAADAERAAERARAAAAAGLDRARLGEASARLAQAREVEAAVAAGEGTLAAMTVDAARVERLRQAERDLGSERDRLGAQATAVEIDALAGAPAIRVAAGGRAPVAAGPAISVVEDTDLLIEGVGTIRLRPAISGRDATLRRLAEAERSVARLLAELDVASLEEAEAALAARAEGSAALVTLRQRLAGLAPGDEAVGLAAGTEALAAEVERLRRVVGGVAEADRETLVVRLREAEARRRDADAARSLASAFEQQAAKDASDRRAAAASARMAAELSRDAARGQATVLAAAERAASDTALVAAAAAMDAGRVSAEGLVRTLAEGADDAPEMLARRIDRLDEKRVNREARERHLGERIASLRARIDAEGGAGLDEALAELGRTADAMARRVAAWDREVAALERLASTLRESLGEARAATMLPLTRRIAPHLALLIPGARIECDADFRVSAVHRGGGSEPFETLSDGTREQIAILARLAYAGLLVDRGKPAMMILDDALAFSDERRVEHMFDILADAATRMQILVLTCRGDLFSRLGGTRVFLEPGSLPAM